MIHGIFEKMIVAAQQTGRFLSASRKEKVRRQSDSSDSVDLVAQRLAQQVLGRGKIVAEDDEASHTALSKKGPYLTLDPLDGSDVYLYTDSPDYGVMVGRVANGQPRQGVIFLPEHHVLLAADTRSALIHDRKTDSRRYQAAPHKLRRTFVGVSLNAKNDPQLYRKAYEKLRRKAAGVMSFGSNAAGFRALLFGHIGAYVCISGKQKNVWEWAAGDVITRQAGGVSSDYNGHPLRWDQLRVIGIWSTNQALHEEILTVVQA